MNSRISDNIRLLGLIIKTIPFNNNNNHITSNYDGYVEIEQLSELKKKIEEELINNIFSDFEKQILNDDIYFLDSILFELKKQ